jgi:hypothetical protein
MTTGVETIGVSNYDAHAGVTTLDTQAMTGVTNVSLTNSSGTGDTVFDNVQNMVDGYAKGAGDMTITYAASVVTGTADVQNVTVDTYTGTLTTAGVETLNLTASGGKSTLVDIAATSATAVTVDGDQNLTITADLNVGFAAAKSIDATDLTGKLTVTSSDTTLATFIGGSGNDTLIRNVQNGDAAATDSFNAGDGTDTLSVTTGANISAANLAKYSNFETLKITGAHGATVDLTDVSMFTNVLNANASNGTTTISGVQAGTTFALTTSNDTSDSVTLDLQNENNAGDATTITFGTTAAGVTLGTLTASDYETLNLVTQGGAASINSLVDADLTTLNVSGAKNLTVTAATAASLATIDASTMTGKFIMGATMGKATIGVTTGSGDDTVYMGSGTSTISTFAGNDTITGGAAASLGGVKTINAGAGNDNIEVNDFSDLTSADTVDGGDGTDTLKFSEDADHNFTTDISQLNGISNVEKYSFSAFASARTVTINDTIMNNNAITLQFDSTITGNITNVLNASGVLNSTNTVTFTDNSASAANTTYSVGNGVDIVSLGALADVLTVSNYAFLSAADTISGGTGADTANIDINGGASAAARVTISDTLNGLSGFETINIDDGAATYIGLTLTDTIVNANQANNALTIGLADSGGTATTALGLVDASGVTATVAIDMTGGGAVDTLKGGAGSDTLQGGLGLDVIDVSAGGADDVTLTGSVAANADKITGFTLAGTGATAASGTDQIVFTADETSNAADIFDTGNGVVFAATDPDAVAGAIVNLVATDYVEAVGGGTAAGSDNHVVVITGTGYVTADAALDGNGGQNGESVVITFYNTSTQRAEIHNAHDADGDTTTLLAYFTDIGLSDMSSFSAANFAIESLG